MEELHGLADLTEEEILGRAESCALVERQAAVDLLRLAHEWSVRHNADRLDPRTSVLPGREKARQLAGDGTAAVTEFAAVTFGARLGISTHAATRLIADAQDLHHRHPELWSRVEVGEVKASYARHVVTRTRELSREERSRQARFARKTRGGKHGMATFMVRADVATIELIDAAVTGVAERLADTLPDDPSPADPDIDSPDTVPMSADDRRVHALRLLATANTDRPGLDLREVMPKVTLHLHAYAGPREIDTDGHPVEAIARLESHGPVTESWINRVLGPTCRFTIRPVLDLAGQAPVDSYEIPARHRRAVQMIAPYEVFPFGTAPTRGPRTQIDHTEPYVHPDSGGPPGQSRIGNYGPLGLLHHRAKTHSGWQVRQPFPGIHVWRDPHGGFYLVDHTGTRRIPHPPVNLTLDYVVGA